MIVVFYAEKSRYAKPGAGCYIFGNSLVKHGSQLLQVWTRWPLPLKCLCVAEPLATATWPAEIEREMS